MSPFTVRRRSAAGLQAALALPRSRAAQKKPARLRFKSRGFSSRAWVVYKPAGRWLAGFQATPTLGIKMQTCVIFSREQHAEHSLPLRRDLVEQPGAQEGEGHEDEGAACVADDAHSQAAHHNTTQGRAAADAEVEDA